MFILSVIAIIYTSLTTLQQTDLKRVIAYSSVNHMGFVTLGLFTLNQQGIEGAILLMVSHGIIAASLFLLIGLSSAYIFHYSLRNYTKINHNSNWFYF